MKPNKVEFMEYSLNTQITWIKDADTKASILLAVIGAFFALFNYLRLFEIVPYITAYKHNYWPISFMVISVAALGLGALCFLITLLPSLKLTKANSNSYLYFGSIHSMDNFQKKFKKYLKSTFFDPSNDLTNQIKIDANIASSKMKWLKCGTWFILIGFISSIALFIARSFF